MACLASATLGSGCGTNRARDPVRSPARGQLGRAAGAILSETAVTNSRLTRTISTSSAKDHFRIIAIGRASNPYRLLPAAASTVAPNPETSDSLILSASAQQTPRPCFPTDHGEDNDRAETGQAL